MILVNLTLMLAIQASALSAIRLVPDEYPSIQAAINDCNDGDIIIVEPGRYFETINFSGKNIILTGTDPNDPQVVAGTIIDAESDGSTVIFENGETAEAVLRGFTITGGYGTRNDAFGGGLLWGGGIYCAEASPTITDNVIAGNHAPCIIEGNQEDYLFGYGAAIGGVEANPTITRNIIKDNTTYAGAGIFIVGEPVISNNLIYGNSAFIGGGVIMAGGQLRNNTIVGNDASFQGGSQLGGNVYIIFEPEFPSTHILNNVICNATSGGGIIWDGVLSPDAIQFNNVWNNNPGNYGSADPGTGQFIFDGQADQTGIDGNISQDPLFVDAQANDYHLQTDSPCINSGDSSLVPAPGETDIDGESRIYGSRIDMGADEYVGYVKPVAHAGHDQHLDKPRLITLDGSASFFYDPCGVMEFSWEQVAGSAVVMSDFSSVQPTFTPESEGEYKFELVVSDGLSTSEPDEVLIIVRNRAPVANAGPDQSTSSIPLVINLDGSGSYDQSGDAVTYHWSQTAGPAVVLSDVNSVEPTFVPTEIGTHVFELVVNDGELDSEPDIVGIVIGNHAPVANAGLSRYAAGNPVVLDGSGSFDRDVFGDISYQWQQISGPPVEITDENTVMPSISGFIQTNAIQRCEFELTVSDGDLASQPDIVEVIIVPDFGNNYLLQLNPPFDPNKPTIVAFGEGDCVMGVGLFFSDPDDWHANANFLTISMYVPPYHLYGDALIVYLSSVAPDYTQPIQTIGYNTGNMPAIDVANHLNETYADARFAVNRVSLLDAACRIYSDDIAKFLASSVDGEACWIDNYYSTMGTYYPGTLNIRYPVPPADYSTPFIWYQQSHQPSGPRGNIYNNGVTAGYYISVAGPDKNLRLPPDANNYYFEWNFQTGYLRFYNESLYPAHIPEAVSLAGPEDGVVVDANGVVLSCDISENAVSYQLLFGAAPNRLNYLVSDTPGPPEETITIFPFETTYWTIKVRDEYGSTVYTDPIRIKAQNVTAQTIENITSGKRYNSIQDAINDAASADEIVVGPGIYQHYENIDFKGKALTVRSTDPNDSTVVAATVINGGQGSAITFSGSGDGNDLLAGFTITGGNNGIRCINASPKIINCVITGNSGPGIELFNQSNAVINNCVIAANQGAGIEMLTHRSGRIETYNYATITNCTIAGNTQQGILDGVQTITNSIIYSNGADYNNIQIDSDSATVTFSDIQGGFPGEGNIDTDPLFADADNGDYHLKSQAGRWDTESQTWVMDELTSPCIDAGDPASDWTAELWPHGERINMGAFGGTPQASMSF